MENIYCTLTGGRIKTMRVKLLLRLLNLILLSLIYICFGIDWVIVLGLVVVVADLDQIAEMIEKKMENKC